MPRFQPTLHPPRAFRKLSSRDSIPEIFSRSLANAVFERIIFPERFSEVIGGTEFHGLGAKMMTLQSVRCDGYLRRVATGTARFLDTVNQFLAKAAEDASGAQGAANNNEGGER